MWLKPGKRIFYGADFSGFDRRHIITDSIPGLTKLNTDEFGKSGRRKFCIADWNNDGRRDFLVNSVNVSLVENTGMENGIVQLKNVGQLGNLVLAGHTTSPTTVDWDNDGKRDLVVGAEDGHFYFLSNGGGDN